MLALDLILYIAITTCRWKANENSSNIGKSVGQKTRSAIIYYVKWIVCRKINEVKCICVAYLHNVICEACSRYHRALGFSHSMMSWIDYSLTKHMLVFSFLSHSKVVQGNIWLPTQKSECAVKQGHTLVCVLRLHTRYAYMCCVYTHIHPYLRPYLKTHAEFRNLNKFALRNSKFEHMIFRISTMELEDFIRNIRVYVLLLNILSNFFDTATFDLIHKTIGGLHTLMHK